ncbi:nitroreductase family protein [Lactococcus sp.]|uniref:nitroreductase family protein n=1 Tax=Lactococcus sp. TaxID=44273 RepID=UPI0035B03D30
MKITNDFSEIMSGRKSVRVYDENVKISNEEFLEMFEEAALAPSSVNMQPWHFMVLASEQVKAEILPFMRFNGKQTETSAAMILILGDTQADENNEKIYRQLPLPKEIQDKYIAGNAAEYATYTAQKRIDIANIDGGLVAMNLILVAREHGYDTNPIGGFDRDKICALLNIDATRFVPVMFLAIGKALEPGHVHFRRDVHDFVSFK